MGWREDDQKIDEAMKKFPSEFGLRGFPNKKFHICKADCYVNDDGTVMLYTAVYDPDTDSWPAFAKGTIEELRKEIVPLNTK